MFEGPNGTTREDRGARRPGVGTVLALLLMLGLFANAALFGVASDAARRLPDHTTLSPLRGGQGPGGLSTDAPSTARATLRPQRGAGLLPVTSFRALGWKPPKPVARGTSRGCPAQGEAV